MSNSFSQATCAHDVCVCIRLISMLCDWWHDTTTSLANKLFKCMITRVRLRIVDTKHTWCIASVYLCIFPEFFPFSLWAMFVCCDVISLSLYRFTFSPIVSIVGRMVSRYTKARLACKNGWILYQARWLWMLPIEVSEKLLFCCPIDPLILIHYMVMQKRGEFLRFQVNPMQFMI